MFDASFIKYGDLPRRWCARRQILAPAGSRHLGPHGLKHLYERARLLLVSGQRQAAGRPRPRVGLLQRRLRHRLPHSGHVLEQEPLIVEAADYPLPPVQDVLAHHGVTPGSRAQELCERFDGLPGGRHAPSLGTASLGCAQSTKEEQHMSSEGSWVLQPTSMVAGHPDRSPVTITGKRPAAKRICMQ